MALPTLTRAQLGAVFKDQRTLLAFDAFQQQLANTLPDQLAALEQLRFVVATPDGLLPNAVTLTAGSGQSITAGPGTLTLAVVSAPKWTNARTLSFTGDAAGTLAGVDGSGDIAGTLTLSIVNTSPGTYALASVTVDNKGRVTNAAAASTTGSGSVVRATSPTITTPAIVGVTNGSNAAAGNDGEYIPTNIPSGSAVTLSSGVAADVGSVVLQPGIYELWGSVVFNNVGGSNTSVVGWISTTSATVPTPPNNGAHFGFQFTVTPTFDASFPVGRMRLNLTVPTTAYLSAWSTFTGASKAYGFLGVRRIP